jgi:hypothetical protein
MSAANGQDLDGNSGGSRVASAAEGSADTAEAAADVAVTGSLNDDVAAAEIAAPDVTAPAVEAAGVEALIAPASPHAPGADTCKGPVRQITVGYEPGIPLSGGQVETRAMRVLEYAFPKPCYTLSLKSSRREDLAPSIVKGQIDIGVLGVPSAVSHAEAGVTSLPAADTAGVDVVMLHPASYAVVSARPEVAPAAAARHTDVWVLLPLGLLAGVVALAFSIYILNFRLLRFGPAAAPASSRIDPRLARLGSTAHWMYAATSGRLLTLIWAVFGAVLVVQLASSQDVVHAALQGEWRPLDGAQLAAYPGRDIYELRDERWKKCPRPYKCLHNYQQGVTQALAGDRDVLCRYEAQTHATVFEFMPDIAVPLLYALLLPSAPARGASDATSVQSVLLEALQHESYSGSPFRACSTPGERGASRR